MKCTSCAAAERVHDICNRPYTYKDESSVIPAMTGNFCTVCGKVVFEAVESVRTGPPSVQVALFKRRNRRPDLLNGIRTTEQ